jgi:hypothetical protein
MLEHSFSQIIKRITKPLQVICLAFDFALIVSSSSIGACESSG